MKENDESFFAAIQEVAKQLTEFRTENQNLRAQVQSLIAAEKYSHETKREK